MTKPQVPLGNQVYFYVTRRFDPITNLTSIDVLDVLVEIGFSRAEAKRRMKRGGVKIWDTRVVEGTKWGWYQRPVKEKELIEPGEGLIFGSPALVIINKEPRRREKSKLSSF